MATPLTTCTKEQCAVIRYLWSEGATSAEIIKDHLHSLIIVLQHTVCEWIEMLQNG